jgi:hypothetical protein
MGNKRDETNDILYEELVCVFDQFLKYHTKILLGYFNAKVGREYIFKPTTGNETLIKLVMIKNLSRVQHSHIATFTNTL